MKYYLYVSVGIFLLSGCGASNEKLVKRAEFDLDCPANKIEIVDIGKLTKGIKGCGKRATYVESCNHFARAADGCTWVLNTNLDEKK